MGFYIEDQLYEHKIEWVHRVCTSYYSSCDLNWSTIRDKDELPVVIIHNTYFRCVAVAYSIDEMRALDDDKRKKEWCGIPYSEVKRAANKAVWQRYMA